MTFRIVPVILSILLSMAVLQTVHGIPACPVQEMRAVSTSTSAEHANCIPAGRLQAAETWTLAGLQAAHVKGILWFVMVGGALLAVGLLVAHEWLGKSRNFFRRDL